MNEYENFDGILIKKKKVLFASNITILTLRNENEKLCVKFGSSGANILELGQRYRIGHIGSTVINIRPIKNTAWKPNHDYDAINFHGGIVTFYEELGEDILTVEYDNDYSIDVGYVENRYCITILKNENWNPYISQVSSADKKDMLRQLQDAINQVVNELTS